MSRVSLNVVYDDSRTGHVGVRTDTYKVERRQRIRREWSISTEVQDLFEAFWRIDATSFVISVPIPTPPPPSLGHLRHPRDAFFTDQNEQEDD